jgi:hypothetical protein
MTLGSHWGQPGSSPGADAPWQFAAQGHLASSEALSNWSWRGDSNPQPPVYKVQAEGPLPSADG